MPWLSLERLINVTRQNNPHEKLERYAKLKNLKGKWEPVSILSHSLIISYEHYCDVIMSPTASQITSLTIVYSIVYSGTDQRKHQSSASLAFVRGSHRRPVNSPHKWPVTRKMFPFDDVIMNIASIRWYNVYATAWNNTNINIYCYRNVDLIRVFSVFYLLIYTSCDIVVYFVLFVSRATTSR